MFKKTILITITFLLLTACSTSVQNEMEPAQPDNAIIEEPKVISSLLTAINENHKFSFQDAFPTQITITPIKLDPLRLKVIIFEDMLKDDSQKSEEHTMIAEQQDDGSWLVTESELTDFECWRGKTDDGCI